MILNLISKLLIFRVVQLTLPDVETQVSHQQISLMSLFTCQPGKSPLHLLLEVIKLTFVPDASIYSLFD